MKPYIHLINDCKQGEDAWHDHRLGSVGGSSASAMVAGGAGKTRTSLMYKLAAEKATKQPTFFKPNDYMIEGTRREEESRNYLAFSEDLEIHQCALIKNDKHPGAHYSPDGFNIEKKCIVELKNPAGHTQVELIQKQKIGKAYIDQMQFGLMISEFDYCIFLSYVPGIKPFIKRIDRDDKYIADLQIKLELFQTELDEILTKIRG